MPTELDEPIAAPRPRDEQRPAPFPLAASVAPLLASGVLWAVTQSVFALVFALLSPVVAVAGMLDARRHARRRRREDGARFERELHLARRRIEQGHIAERAELADRVPGAAAALDPARIGLWRADPARFAHVSLGIGAVASSLHVTGSGTDDESGLKAEAAVLSAAPVEADASVGIGIAGPPALARALARGYLIQLADAFAPDRMALRLVTGLPSPGATGRAATGAGDMSASAGGGDASASAGAEAQIMADAWGWARVLPHVHDDDVTLLLELRDDMVSSAVRQDEVGARMRGQAIARTQDGVTSEPVHIAAAPGTRHALIAVARTPQQLPPGCRIVVAVDGATTARVIAGPATLSRAAFVPELVPEPAAAGFAADLHRRARAAGLLRSTALLPVAVRFDELKHSGGPGLTCTIGVQASGSFTIDLVGSGPHAVVAGTTGSGKSELLVTWITAMASARSPNEVSFLLVDFKGGTAFAPLTGLPHTVGVITDLGHGEALRALQSLQAELRRRERVLASVGARDIEQAQGALGRLVIVVDEFAAMLDAFPELNPVFTDVAARGRALGIHLVLCTQRATGVVRDALLANCALRLSLRVTSGADSVAVLGTDAAARLSPATPGRCIVAHDGEHSTVQVASTDASQIDRIAGAANGMLSGRPPRPWLDPLPETVHVADLERSEPDGVAIALCDRPDEQRRHTVHYHPAREHLLVSGMRGSGKSSLVAVVASQWSGSIVTVPDDIESGWDAIESVYETPNATGVSGVAGTLVGNADAGAGNPSGRWAGDRAHASEAHSTVVLIDDVDALLDRFDGEYRDVLADRLLALLRDGPRRGVSVVCTATRSTQALRPLLPLLGTTIVLGQVSKQDHLLAGAPAELFEERARPGLGVWQGHRVQLAVPDDGLGIGRAVDSVRPDVVGFPAGSTTVLVSRAPGRVAAELRRRWGDGVNVLDIATVFAGAGVDVPGGGLPSESVPSAGTPDEGAPGEGASGEGAADHGAPSDPSRAAVDHVAVVLVGDADAWLAHWPMLSRLRGRARVVFEGCTVADVRGILRSRVLPPPLADVDGRVWIDTGVGELTRARLW